MKTTPERASSPRPLRGEPDWRHRAACIGRWEWFFGDEGDELSLGRRVAHAKEICASCPVTAECLGFAVRNGEEYGIWAGHRLEAKRRAA